MRLKGISLAAAMTLTIGGASMGAVVYSDDFDGPTTYWNGRNDFDTLDVHPPDIGDAWYSNYLGVLRDGSAAGYPAPLSGFYGSSEHRVTANLSATGANATENQLVRMTFNAYISPKAGAGLSGLEVTTWETGFVAGPRGTDMWLRGDGKLTYYTNGSGFVDVPAVDFSFATGQWVSVELETDYLTGAVTLTIGSESHSFSVADPASNRVDEIFFQNESGTGYPSAYPNGFDNLVVDVIPEPTGLAILALGALALRRRK